MPLRQQRPNIETGEIASNGGLYCLAWHSAKISLVIWLIGALAISIACSPGHNGDEHMYVSDPERAEHIYTMNGDEQEAAEMLELLVREFDPERGIRHEATEPVGSGLLESDGYRPSSPADAPGQGTDGRPSPRPEFSRQELVEEYFFSADGDDVPIGQADARIVDAMSMVAGSMPGKPMDQPGPSGTKTPVINISPSPILSTVSTTVPVLDTGASAGPRDEDLTPKVTPTVVAEDAGSSTLRSDRELPGAGDESGEDGDERNHDSIVKPTRSPGTVPPVGKTPSHEVVAETVSPEETEGLQPDAEIEPSPSVTPETDADTQKDAMLDQELNVEDRDEGRDNQAPVRRSDEERVDADGSSE